MLGGPIFALDLATRTGFAVGPAGSVPESGSVRLKRPGEPRGIALGNLIAFLDERWRKERPGVVVIEAPLPLQGFAALGNAEATVRMTYGLSGVVEAMCARYGIPFEEVRDSTARKHLTGSGRFGDRETTKRAVLGRCIALGYLPKNCTDDNRSDACCVFAWAEAHIARKPPNELHFFGERARA